MSKYYLTTPINVPLGKDVLCVKEKLAKHIGVRVEQIRSVALNKQSVDARDKGNVHFVCSYLVQCDVEPRRNATLFLPPRDILDIPSSTAVGKSCLVVGAGPSGLFLARYLSQCGVKVTVVERGSDVSLRQKKVQEFFAGGKFDENCNVQFGLGGAGTFSDGKLTTGISSPLLHTVFAEFVRRGAPGEILTSSLPHIGTDNLVNVVANMKSQVEKFGGEFLFETICTDLIVKNGKIVGVEVQRSGRTEQLFADCVALCIGHSSRELFGTLQERGVDLAFKPFAVGLRVEHSREFINKVQFGELFATHRDLGAASYKLVNNVGKRSCYSFCMCPGGFVVPSNSSLETVVVNGMSNYKRDAQNSNSALVVTVGSADVERYGFGNDALSGMNFQVELEKQTYKIGGGNYKAPCQNVVDFVANRESSCFDIQPSYFRGVSFANLRSLLPDDICEIMVQSLEVFNKKMKGFAQCGVLTGVETRTSSPVKILRDETFQASICGLFVVGEGAGYAGGIVSSAVDGLKVAQAIETFLHNL